MASALRSLEGCQPTHNISSEFLLETEEVGWGFDIVDECSFP